jgi:hypothetical protein
LISKLADWITVVTAPLTVVTTLGAWLGWFGAPPPVSNRTYLTSFAVAGLAVLSVWSFMFFGHLRLFVLLARRFEDLMALSLAAGVSAVVLLFFVAIEMLLLDVLLPRSDGSILLAWLGAPCLLWLVGAAWLGLLIIGGGESYLGNETSRRTPHQS